MLQSYREALEKYRKSMDNLRSRRVQVGQPYVSPFTQNPYGSIPPFGGADESDWNAPAPTDCSIIRTNIIIDAKYTIELTVKNNVFLPGDILSVGSSNGHLSVTDLELVDENECVLICSFTGNALNMSSLRPGVKVTKVVHTMVMPKVSPYHKMMDDMIKEYQKKTLEQDYSDLGRAIRSTLEHMDLSTKDFGVDGGAAQELINELIGKYVQQTKADNNQARPGRTRMERSSRRR